MLGEATGASQEQGESCTANSNCDVSSVMQILGKICTNSVGVYERLLGVTAESSLKEEGLAMHRTGVGILAEGEAQNCSVHQKLSDRALLEDSQGKQGGGMLEDESGDDGRTTSWET